MINTRSKDSTVFFELNNQRRLHEVSQSKPDLINTVASAALKETSDRSSLEQIASLALSSSASEPEIKNRANLDYYVKEIVRTGNNLPLKIKIGKRKKHTIEEENSATYALFELLEYSKSKASQKTQVAVTPDSTQVQEVAPETNKKEKLSTPLVPEPVIEAVLTNKTKESEAESSNSSAQANSVQDKPLFSKQPRLKSSRGRGIQEKEYLTEPSKESITPILELTEEKTKEAHSSVVAESSSGSKKVPPDYLFKVTVLNDKIYSIMPRDPVDYFKKAERRFRLNSITDTSTNKEYFLDQVLTKSEQEELSKSDNLNLSYDEPKLPVGARLLPKDWLEQMCKKLEQE